jgi:hypothetical protein
MSKKITKIHFNLNTIPIEQQDYKSADNWFDPNEWTGELFFETLTGDTGNKDHNFLILIHALVEQYLCYRKGITADEVTAFDLAHPDSLEPGDEKKSPYRKQHAVATEVEAIVSVALGVDWGKYEESINKMLERYKDKKHD